MRKLVSLFALLAMALVVQPAASAGGPHSYQRRIPRTLAAFPSCGSLTEGNLVIVTDASARDDCDSTPEASPESWIPALCICEGGQRVAAIVVDLAAYAPLAGAAFTGSTSVNVSGGAVELSVTSGSVSFGGDLIIASGEQIRGNGTSPAKIDLDSGSFALTVDPSGAAPNQLLGTSVLSGETILRVQRYIRFLGENALPACSAAFSGVIGFDTSTSEFCGCNGTAWAALDGSGTCD